MTTEPDHNDSPSTKPLRKPRNSLRWITITAIFMTAALGWWVGERRSAHVEALPILGTAPDYRDFKNQLDESVASSRFNGKIRVVTFLFPYCTSYCPLIAFRLGDLERSLKDAGLQNQVQFVAFNVDPQHTGPTQTNTFMQQYGWNPHNTRWQFLTGTDKQTRQVVRDGYHVDYSVVTNAQEKAYIASQKAAGVYRSQPQVVNIMAEHAKPTYDIAHNDALILVDQHGHIRWLTNQADQLDIARLLGMIRTLARHPDR